VPQLKVILFGSGSLEVELKKEVDRLGLESVVQFAGFRSDLRAFLAYFQLLVHPAVREGLGLSLLEAQAAGVPVVGFRGSGVEEAVADGETGILAPVGDAVALADAIESLLSDPDRRAQMATAGPARMRHEFGIERMVQGYVDIYSQVLDELSEGMRR
jgi:glycosyltransferase involved in cell wall biosynthesis